MPFGRDPSLDTSRARYSGPAAAIRSAPVGAQEQVESELVVRFARQHVFIGRFVLKHNSAAEKKYGDPLLIATRFKVAWNELIRVGLNR